MAYYVYVVTLDPAAWDSSKAMRKANPQVQGVPRVCYYVGSSAFPVKRVADHLRGGKATNKLVSDFFSSVVYKYAQADDWDDVVSLEEDVAEELRAKDAAVYHAV